MSMRWNYTTAREFVKRRGDMHHKKSRACWIFSGTSRVRMPLPYLPCSGSATPRLRHMYQAPTLRKGRQGSAMLRICSGEASPSSP